MNISIIMDDNGNPIFSQEGTIDINTVIRDVLIDQDDLKDVFTDKFESLAESIKIDADKISTTITDNITDLFTFSSDFKDDVQDSFKTKVDDLLDSVSIDKDSIANNMKSLFSYKGKEAHMKKIFDKINKSIPSTIKTQGNAKNIDKENTVGNKPMMGLWEKMNKLNPPKNQNSDESVFDEGAKPVHLLSVEPSLLKLLQGSRDKYKLKDGDEKDEKGKPWLKWLLKAFGIAGGGSILSFAALKSGLMGKLTSLSKLPSGAMKFATNPLTLLLAGVVWGVIDGIKATLNADEWGVDKISAALGGFLAGSADGIFANMGKWALMGAAAGSVVPFFGTIVGGLLGAMVGAILSAIGPEKIAQKFQKLKDWADPHLKVFNETLEKAFDFFFVFLDEFDFKEGVKAVIEDIKDLWKQLQDKIESGFDLFFNLIDSIPKKIQAMKDNLKSVIEDFKTSFSKIPEKIKAVFTKITESFGFLQEKMDALMDNIKKLNPFSKTEEEKRIKELEDIQDEIVDQRREAMDMSMKLRKQEESIHKKKIELAKLESENKTKDAAKLQEKIDKAQKEMSAGEQSLQKTQNKLETLKKEKTSLSNDANVNTVKGQDVVTSPQGLQIQLDSKDSLETYGDQSIYSKEGGTLDNAIQKVADKLETQLNEMTMFKEMFKDYMKYVSAYNSQMLEMIPSLASGNSEPMIPAEQSVPQGYIRDPNFEYRMRMREMLG